ncbi:MAG: peptide ABC transporter substrate-binding protein [Oligoflexia bacterium]|nr:peptide ABC transporter substrate-binding protein [Oligoflexia bacterium]
MVINRYNRRIRIGFVSRLFSIALLLASASAGAAELNTFTMRLSQEPETLDWNRAHTPIETNLLVNLMEGLVSFDEKLKPVPQLAESWKISPDGLTYTFHLRAGVLWSDSVPLRAQDFVASWKRLLSPATAAPYAYLLYDIVGAEEYGSGKLKDFSQVGISAPDDHTFVVKLKKPVAHWIDIPTFWVTFPVREDVVAKYGLQWESPGRMVTLGPFILTAHDVENRIVMRANPLYWAKRGNVDQVVGLIVKDDATAVSLYESGKIDFVTDLDTVNLSRLAGNPELKTFPYLKTAYLGFVPHQYPSSNLKFRRAVAMAIDKSQFGRILHGNQTPATSFVPPGLAAYSQTLGLPFDPVRAKQELQESGLADGRTISFDAVLASGDQMLTLMQYVQAQLKTHLGIQANLEPFDNKTFRAQLELASYPMFLLSWSADYPDPDNFLSLWLGESGNNRTRWKNSQYDDLVLAARYAKNSKEREKYDIAAQKILLEQEAVIVPLYYEPIIALVKKRVQALEMNPLNYMFLKKVNLVVSHP